VATASQNPIIRIVAEHFAKGDNPIKVRIDDSKSETPKGIVVILEDGQEILHPIDTKNRRELFDMFVKSSNWWCRVKWGEIEPDEGTDN